MSNEVDRLLSLSVLTLLLSGNVDDHDGQYEGIVILECR